MPIDSAPFVRGAARRVLRTTANAWRLKAPARRPVRTRARPQAGVGAGTGVGAGMWPCPVRASAVVAGYGLAFSY